MPTPHKFRVYDGDQMHEPPHDFALVCYERQDVRVSGCREILWGKGRFSDEVYDPMFSTGLADAEGTEIYEGDILTCDSIRWDGPFLVEWSNEYGWWDMACDQSTPYFLGEHNDSATVVGNRFEDADLLEARA